MGQVIIEAASEWADKYRLFCQRAYKEAYVRPEIGITDELFSVEVFNSPRVIKYFADLIRSADDHRAWLVIDNNRQIIGGAVAHRFLGFCEMKSFYVASEM